MNKGFFNKTEVKGIVERRLFDSQKLFETLKKMGVEFELEFDKYSFREICVKGAQALGNETFAKVLDKSAKAMFADNKIWKLLKAHFNVDVKIPFVTGMWTTKAIKANLVVNTGHKKYADQVGGTTTAPVTAIAIGTGTTAAAATDTALQTEITTNGGARGAATVSNTTTSTTGDTEQWQKTFTFTGSFAVTEEGLFDNNASGGIMLAHQVFAAVNVVSSDTLQVTHKIQS